MDMSSDESFLTRTRGRRSLQALEAMLDAGSPALREAQISKTLRRKSAVTAVNVQKSLQLLDESVSSAGNRSLRTPGGSVNISSYVPKLLAPGNKFDVSSRMGIVARKTPKKDGSFHRSMQEESMSSPFRNLSGMAPVIEMEGDEVTTTNVGLLLEEDPGVSSSKDLYMDFLQCLRDHPSEGELFTLVEGYEKLCQDQVVLLKKLVRHASRQEEKFTRTFNVLQQLSDEECTWKLIKNLFKDRQETAMKEEFMMDEMKEEPTVVQGVHQSDARIANDLLDKDQSVREAQVVVDWLESSAQDNWEYFSENIKFFSDRAVGYENAKHRLQTRSSGLPIGADRSLITELDPDAPIRQNKLLDDLDKEDEDRLLQYIFVCIRAGQLEKAQKMCIDCGQAWRAATLEGWRLFHDPNYEGLGPECQRTPVEGNPNRDIWKLVCWNMTQDPKVNVYEKAIYSALSGNLRGMLPVCKSWVDYVWAYFRVLVDMRVEEEIRLKTTIGRGLESLPGQYYEKNLNARVVFREIEANETMQKEANALYHVIQKYIILEDITGLLDILHEKMSHGGPELSLHTLRFMAHFVLFLRKVGQHSQEDICNLIIERYVEELIKNKQYSLLAHYVSKLPASAQVHWYAQFLEGITTKEDRARYLDLAEEAGLDVAAITKRVVENIRSKSQVDFSSLQDTQASVDTHISE
ncbi:hypothetical protein DPMN_085255, partial [Dreissena polymorpha]